MTFIPKKSRIIPLSVALITALSMGTVAFADATYYTSYGINANTATVTSTISGLDATSQQVTFLVNKTHNPATPIVASDIIYIDQRDSASATSLDFQFTTPTSNLSINTSVKFGTSSATTIVAGTEAADGRGIPSDILWVSSPTLSRSVVSSDNIFKSLVANEPTNYLLTFGTLTNATADDECGILFADGTVEGAQTALAKLGAENSESSDNYATITALTPISPSVRKFPSLGRNSSNQFAIKLVNETSSIFVRDSGKTCYIRTYAIYNKGTATAPINVVYLGPVQSTTL